MSVEDLFGVVDFAVCERAEPVEPRGSAPGVLRRETRLWDFHGSVRKLDAKSMADVRILALCLLRLL